jgi:hypothetical protein
MFGDNVPVRTNAGNESNNADIGYSRKMSYASVNPDVCILCLRAFKTSCFMVKNFGSKFSSSLVLMENPGSSKFTDRKRI